MKPTLKTTALAMCIALSLAACKSTSNSGDARPTPVQPKDAKPGAAQSAATQPADAKPGAAQPAATQPAEEKHDEPQAAPGVSTPVADQGTSSTGSQPQPGADSNGHNADVSPAPGTAESHTVETHPEGETGSHTDTAHQDEPHSNETVVQPKPPISSEPARSEDTHAAENTGATTGKEEKPAGTAETQPDSPAPAEDHTESPAVTPSQPSTGTDAGTQPSAPVNSGSSSESSVPAHSEPSAPADNMHTEAGASPTVGAGEHHDETNHATEQPQGTPAQPPVAPERHDEATHNTEGNPSVSGTTETQPAASSYDALNKLFYQALVDHKSSDLVDATYKGKVFAKVKLDTKGEKFNAPTTTDEDGDVTLDVQKNSSDKFKMSGTIDSKTVGRIKLGEEEIIENKVENGHVGFSDEDMEGGKYSATISKDGDIVGRVVYDSDSYEADFGSYPRVQGKDGATKNLFRYEAFFDATKQH